MTSKEIDQENATNAFHDAIFLVRDIEKLHKNTNNVVLNIFLLDLIAEAEAIKQRLGAVVEMLEEN